MTSYRPEHSPELEAPWNDPLSLFRTQVRDVGTSPFIHYFSRTLSFGEVDQLSDALALALQDRGVGPGDRIALYLQNNPQFPIAALATWKLHGIVVPVNPMLRERELHYQLADSGAKVVVCLEELLPIVEAARSDIALEVVITTGARDFLADGSVPSVLGGAPAASAEGRHDDLLSLCSTAPERVGSFDPEISRSDPAILVYTSGTTGPPKGAVITHGNVAFNAVAKREWFLIGDNDVILVAAPLFHITGFVAGFGLAVAGAAPMVLTHRFDALTVASEIERHRVTFTVAPITAYIALMNAPDIGKYDLSTLTKAYSGGAPVPPSVVARYSDKFGVQIHNAYGLSETTAATHAQPLGSSWRTDPASGTLSIGIPYFNTDVKVIDDSGSELPPGEIGELVIAGPQIASGYWNKPEETDLAFHADGFFRTGDVGFYDAEGWFYLVDRKKDLIICSGYKVWPREVEDVLYEHPAVSEAAVVGVPDEYRGESVKAYVTLRPGASCEPNELIDFCRTRLAAYKYPRAVEVLPELPKTATGKIRRRDLRAADNVNA